MTRIMVTLALLLLAGCATTEREHWERYYDLAEGAPGKVEK